MKPNVVVAFASVLLFAFLVLTAGCGASQAQPSVAQAPSLSGTSSSAGWQVYGYQLPELRKIVSVTLSPTYSCRSADDFAKGYQNTGLFLSGYSKTRQGPELLFNGACGSPDYFEGQTGGDDFDVIADYGDVPLMDWAPENAFSPLRRVDSVATFADHAYVQLGHTYGMLINKREIRGLLYFKVTGYVPNQKVDLEYAVMDYQILRVQALSPGFDWRTKPSY